MEQFYIYLIPLAICILTSWIFQLSSDSEAAKIFAVFAFVPLINIIFAAIGCILLVGWIGIAIAFLPTHIKKLLK